MLSDNHSLHFFYSISNIILKLDINKKPIRYYNNWDILGLMYLRKSSKRVCENSLVKETLKCQTKLLLSVPDRLVQR